MIALNALNRLCAIPCQARDIQQAHPFTTESGLALFNTSLGPVSRTAITGLLVSWDGTAGLIDDGTGNVLLRSAQAVPDLLSAPLGSIIFCIGRVRTLGNERYVSIETAHVLHNTYWLTYRKFETALFRESATPVQNPPPERTTPAVAAQIPIEHEEWRDQLLKAIHLLDTGDGADVNLILRQTKQEDDTLIQKLIRDGDVYEIKPGKIKTLE